MQSDTQSKLEKQCEQCGTGFVAQRSTARYCSPSCRVKAFNGRQSGETSADNATPDESSEVFISPIKTPEDEVCALGETTTKNVAANEGRIEGISYRHVKAGTPGVCGFCSLPLDLDQEGFALVDGIVMIGWPQNKEICRNCVSTEERARFAKVREKEDQAEQAIIDERNQSHESRFQELRKTACRAKEIDPAPSLSKKQLFFLAFNSVRMDARVVKSACSLVAARKALTDANLAVARYGDEFKTLPRKCDPLVIDRALEAGAERIAELRQVVAERERELAAVIPRATETFKEVFFEVAGFPLPEFEVPVFKKEISRGYTQYLQLNENWDWPKPNLTTEEARLSFMLGLYSNEDRSMRPVVSLSL